MRGQSIGSLPARVGPCRANPTFPSGHTPLVGAGLVLMWSNKSWVKPCCAGIAGDALGHEVGVGACGPGSGTTRSRRSYPLGLARMARIETFPRHDVSGYHEYE